MNKAHHAQGLSSDSTIAQQSLCDNVFKQQNAAQQFALGPFKSTGDCSIEPTCMELPPTAKGGLNAGKATRKKVSVREVSARTSRCCWSLSRSAEQLLLLADVTSVAQHWLLALWASSRLALRFRDSRRRCEDVSCW
jgi:hypothetical protein